MKTSSFVSRTVLALGSASLLLLASGCNPHPRPTPPPAAPTNGKAGTPTDAKDKVPMSTNPGPHH